MKPRISAIVHTYNAEQHLARCLDALQGFDEILVVDMESTDRTCEIAADKGARVIVVERGEHRIAEAYRDFAIHEAANDWVIVVDADEIVPPKLRDYLYEQIAADPSPRAYLFPIKNYFMDKWMHAYYPDYILRFFNRKGAHWPYHVHSRPSHEGPEIKLPSSRTDLAYLHLANEDVPTLIRKMNAYTDNEALRRAHNYSPWRMLYEPFFRFFKSYILKGGCRDGWPGFIHAVHDGIYRFYALAKIEQSRRSVVKENDITRDLENL